MSPLEHLHGPWGPWEWLTGEGNPLVSSSTLLLALPLTVSMTSGHSPPVSLVSLLGRKMKSILRVPCSNGCSEKQTGLDKKSLATGRGITHRLAFDFLLLM